MQRHRSYEDFLDIGFQQYRFRILPIAPVHTSRLITLPLVPGHKDPFDRLLIAQAMVEGVAIVSGDPAFDAYQVTRIW